MALAALALRGARRPYAPGLLLVLVVSTVLAHGDTLFPFAWETGVLASTAFVFPVAYQYLFDAGELNRPGARRPTVLLGLCGLTALVVTVGVVRALTGGATARTDAGLASALLPLPVAAAAVAATLRSSGPGQGGDVDV